MEFRTLGRTGQKVAAISLGTEYLINLPREHVVGVIHDAIERGVNYFDLFFAQPELRDNMGAAFAGYRDRVMLAAHLGATWVDGQSDKTRDVALARTFFEDFLRRYNTDYVDVLYLHNCDPQPDYDEIMRRGGLKDLALELKAQGRARFIGFSGHTVSTSLQAVESGVVDVLMFPVNMASQSVPGRNDLFRACAQHNVALVAMKPYGGGRLLEPGLLAQMERWHLGDEARAVAKPTRVTPLQCLSYVLAQVGVSTIVPGCKTLDHLAEAQSYWVASEQERDFATVLQAFRQYKEGECTYCNHCLPCPQHIDVGHTMRLLETARPGLTPALKAEYAAMPTNASDCTECGNCATRCPFDVDVVEKMRETAETFS